MSSSEDENAGTPEASDGDTPTQETKKRARSESPKRSRRRGRSRSRSARRSSRKSQMDEDSPSPPPKAAINKRRKKLAANGAGGKRRRAASAGGKNGKKKANAPPPPNSMVGEQLQDKHKRSGAGILNLLARVKTDDLGFKDFQVEDWMKKPQEKYYLEVLHKKDGTVNKIDIYNKPWIVVGRQWDNDIAINHPSVSRRHAIIAFRREGMCYVYDLGSTHGTYVNDNLPLVNDGRVEKGRFIRLHANMRVVFGRCAYQYKLAVHADDDKDPSVKQAADLIRAQQLAVLKNSVSSDALDPAAGQLSTRKKRV